MIALVLTRRVGASSALGRERMPTRRRMSTWRRAAIRVNMYATSSTTGSSRYGPTMGSRATATPASAAATRPTTNPRAPTVSSAAERRSEAPVDGAHAVAQHPPEHAAQEPPHQASGDHHRRPRRVGPRRVEPVLDGQRGGALVGAQAAEQRQDDAADQDQHRVVPSGSGINRRTSKSFSLLSHYGCAPSMMP